MTALHSSEWSALFDRVAGAWWAWMAPMAWQIALLAALVWSIDRVTRRRAWPEFRLALWAIVVVRLLIPPSWSSAASLTGWVRALPIFARPVSAEPSALHGAVRDVDASLGVETLASAAFAIWIIGIATCVVLELRRHRRLASLLSSEPQPKRLPDELLQTVEDVARRLGLERVPAIVISRRFASPAVFGLVRPRVVLPAHFLARGGASTRVESAERGEPGRPARHAPDASVAARPRSGDRLSRRDPGQAPRRQNTATLEHVLMHELAHIRRKDLWVAAIVRVLSIVYWFHPLVWIAQRELALLRELCCDVTVTCSLRERTAEYRDALLHCAREMVDLDAKPHWSQAGFLHRSSHILLRLAALEQPIWKFTRRRRVGSTLAFALLVVFVLPMAASQDLVAPLSSPESTRTNAISAGTRTLADASAREALDPDLARAYSTVRDAVEGRTRESCLRLHYSAMLIAAHEQDARGPVRE